MVNGKLVEHDMEMVKLLDQFLSKNLCQGPTS